MKAVLDSERYTITLDNEAIKAIRFVRGLNTDLRVKLTASRRIMWEWLDENGVNLFGSDFIFIRKDPTDPEWKKYEYMLNNVVSQIMG